MSHNKCWYTEASEAVSDWHVDHFRPKSTYQWLAFDWSNFRLSGGIPNRCKNDDFPLDGDGQCATWDTPDCSVEQPLLLDPTDPDDPSLMTFDETGLPIPAIGNSPYVETRVQCTTKLLNLDSARLKEARTRRWRECRKRIYDLYEVIKMDSARIDFERRQRIKRIRNEIRDMTRPSEPYSATARACVRAHGLGELLAGPEHS
jgi:uncharacterized protein (TIGR02646 family)